MRFHDSKLEVGTFDEDWAVKLTEWSRSTCLSGPARWRVEVFIGKWGYSRGRASFQGCYFQYQMNQSTPLLKNPPSSPTSSWYEIQLLPMAYETQDLAFLLGSPTSSVPLCPNHGSSQLCQPTKLCPRAPHSGGWRCKKPSQNSVHESLGLWHVTHGKVGKGGSRPLQEVLKGGISAVSQPQQVTVGVGRRSPSAPTGSRAASIWKDSQIRESVPPAKRLQVTRLSGLFQRNQVPPGEEVLVLLSQWGTLSIIFLRQRS